MSSFKYCAVLVLYFFSSVLGENRDFRLFPQLPVQIGETSNSVCNEHGRMYFEHLKNLSLWAHEMQDSTAQDTVGVLRGSFQQFGQFEECLKSQSPFPTQFCMVAITAQIPPPNPPRDPKSLIYEPNESVLRKIYNHKDSSQQPENMALLGWCVPSSCSPQDLNNFLDNYLKKQSQEFYLNQFNVTYTAHIDEQSCQSENEIKDFDYVDYSFCLIVAIIAGLIIMSSIASMFHLEEKTTPAQKLLLAFSIQDNFKKLAKMDDKANPALTILYGVRVFSILMVIMDHRFGTHLASGVLNFNIVEEQYRSAFGTLFFHGDLFVDSFFILSGLLVTYCLLLQYDKKFVNPAFVILMRYIRLTPVYAFVIFFYASLFNYVGFGPMWKTIIAPEVADCRTNWWTNLLYISNYVNPDHMCMVHSWFLPCDFHYFITAILICLLIHKSKKAGLILLGAVTLLSVLVPFLIGFIYERPAVLFFYPDFLRAPKQSIDFLLMYSKSHTRASPYFVGMIAGYIFYKIKDSGKRMNRINSHLLVAISLVMMASSIVTGTIFYDAGYEYNAFESALYAALHRTVWSIGTVGVFYTASYGYSSIIYNFLSWKPWVPLSKLVYGAYLVHMQFQMRSLAIKAGADAVTYYDIICLSLSDIVLAFSTAFVLYLSIEAPFRNIFSALLVPALPKTQRNNNADANDEKTSDSHL